jgi:hypothetical protein
MEDLGTYALLIGGTVVVPLLLVFWMSGFFRRLPPEEKAKDRFSLRLARAPRKRSYTNCPWCLSEIEVVRRDDKALQCPICGCAFRHNFRKWVIAIPMALLIFLFLLRLTKSVPVFQFMPPIVCVFAGLIGSLLATREMPDYNIVNPGADPPPPPTQSEAVIKNEEYRASQHISIHKPRQLAAALTLVAGVFVGVLLFCWLISLAMK